MENLRESYEVDPNDVLKEDISYKCFDKYKNKMINKNVVLSDKLPHQLQEITNLLEVLNELGDDTDYDSWEEVLETRCKNAVLNHKISSKLMQEIFRRYGGVEIA